LAPLSKNKLKLFDFIQMIAEVEVIPAGFLFGHETQLNTEKNDDYYLAKKPKARE
jgi:hypothetical protein